MKIFVGNLSFDSTEDSINKLFENYGTVESCSLIIDRDTGRSRGFAFIEMPNQNEAIEAIKNLNGIEHDGRNIKVNEAQDKPRDSRRDDRRGGGGGGGYGGRGRGGGGGGRGYGR